MAAPRPQTVLNRLTRTFSRLDVLHAMTYAAFESLPPDRAVIYARHLVAAVGAPSYETYLDVLVGRFARWQLLRRLRSLEHCRQVTRGSVQRARAATIFLQWLDDHQVPVVRAGQPQLSAGWSSIRAADRPDRVPRRPVRLRAQPGPISQPCSNSPPRCSRLCSPISSA